MELQKRKISIIPYILKYIEEIIKAIMELGKTNIKL